MNQQKRERERESARGKREDRKGNRSKTRERVLQTPPEAGDRPNPWHEHTQEKEKKKWQGQVNGSEVRGSDRWLSFFFVCYLRWQKNTTVWTRERIRNSWPADWWRDRLTCCHHCTRQRKKWLVFRSWNLRVHNFYTRLARDFFVCLFDWLIFDSMNSSVQFCAKQQKTNELGVRKLTSDAEKDALIEQRPRVCNELIYSFVSLLSFT